MYFNRSKTANKFKKLILAINYVRLPLQFKFSKYICNVIIDGY